MTEFVAEPLEPVGGAFDTAAMGTGLPGLPNAFRWRDQEFQIAAELGSWKHSASYNGTVGGQRYLRRHYWRLRMSDGSAWTVYFIRHTPRSGSSRRRWFIYIREPAESPDTPR